MALFDERREPDENADRRLDRQLRDPIICSVYLLSAPQPPTAMNEGHPRGGRSRVPPLGYAAGSHAWGRSACAALQAARTWSRNSGVHAVSLPVGDAINLLELHRQPGSQVVWVQAVWKIEPVSGREERAPLRRLSGSRPFVPEAPRDGLRGQPLGLAAVPLNPGWSAPHPGPEAEPSCPGSAPGKTQRKPKMEFPTLRLWVIATVP